MPTQGLNALQRFVEAVPAESGMAFVVVVHLDGDVEGESEPGVGTTFMYGYRVHHERR